MCSEGEIWVISYNFNNIVKLENKGNLLKHPQVFALGRGRWHKLFLWEKMYEKADDFIVIPF